MMFPSSFSSLSSLLLLLSTSVVVSGFPESGVNINDFLRPAPHSLAARQQDETPVEICRWWAFGSTMMDNRVYIDGGLQTYRDTKNNFRGGNMFIYYSMSNIDLSRGFKIPLREDDREYTRGGAPNRNGEATIQSGLWNDGDRTVYKFGGQFIDNNTWTGINQSKVRPAQIWKYDTTRAQWEEQPFSVEGGSKSIVRPAGGAYVSVPKLGRAFYLGGVVNPKTDPAFENADYSGYGVLGDSLLDYDFNSATFVNHTTPGIGANAYANLVYVERFGKEGILVLLGGGEGPAGVWLGATDATPRDLGVVHVYDIAENKWYEQKTSGSTPTGRLAACAASIPAKDGTSHNIVLYGGMTMSSQALGDTWVLSLPSFTWVQIDDSGEKRLEHACHVVKGDKLLVIGGRDPIQVSAGDPARNYSVDATNWSCLKDGMVSVLDLSKISWDDELPRDDSDWRIPKAITDAIGGTVDGKADFFDPEAGWSDPALGTLMHIDRENPTPPEPTSKPDGPKKDGPPIAVIVGATVGGVVVLAIIGAVIFCLRRKRKTPAPAPVVAEEAKPLDPPSQPLSPAPYYDGRGSMYDPAAAAYWAAQGYNTAGYPDPNAAHHAAMYPAAAEVAGDSVHTAGGYYQPPVVKDQYGAPAPAGGAVEAPASVPQGGTHVPPVGTAKAGAVGVTELQG